MQRRTLIIAATKITATVLATEIMLLPGYPTASWLVPFSLDFSIWNRMLYRTFDGLIIVCIIRSMRHAARCLQDSVSGRVYSVRWAC